MENVKLCPSCGSKLDGNVKICPSCGKVIGQEAIPSEEKKGCNPVSILLLLLKLTFWPFVLIIKVAKRTFDKKQKAQCSNHAVESLEYKDDAPKNSADKSSVPNAKSLHKRLIFVALSLVVVLLCCLLGRQYHLNKYALKEVSILSNGNVIVKQLQKKSELGEPDKWRFGIVAADGSEIIPPYQSEIFIDTNFPNFVIVKHSESFGYNDISILREGDCSTIFGSGKGTLTGYAYNDDKKTFILRYRKNDTFVYRIGNLQGEIISTEDFSNEIFFALGIQDAYLNIYGDKIWVIDVHGKMYSDSVYYYQGGCAINRKENIFINLCDGEKYEYKKIFEKDEYNSYIEYEYGIMDTSQNNNIVYYVDQDDVEASVIEKLSKADALWLNKKYVSQNQYGCAPYSLVKVVDDIPFYKANFGTYTIPTLYRPGANGEMNISSYNFSLDGLRDYINTSCMYTSSGQWPISITYNKITINGDDVYIRNSKSTEEVARFFCNGGRYEFRYSTENFEYIEYYVSVPANMLHHVPHMVDLSPFVEETSPTIYTTHKKRVYRPWLNKVWSDGTYVFRFDLFNVYVMRDGKYLGSVRYEYNSQFQNISFNIKDPADSTGYPSYYSLYVYVDDEDNVSWSYEDNSDNEAIFEVDVRDIGATSIRGSLR